MGRELLLRCRMRRPVLAMIVVVITAFTAAAQISMQRPGITGIPQARKGSTPKQSPTTLTGDEQKRLATIIKHMKPKDRKKLAQALQKMTPQQRQQLLASVKQQLNKTGNLPSRNKPSQRF